MDFDILTDKLPLYNVNWAIIINPRAVESVDTIEVPGTFRGFDRAKEDSFYVPNSKNRAFNVKLHNLEQSFDQLSEQLNDILEIINDYSLEDIGKKKLWEMINDRREILKNIISDIVKNLKSLKAIDKEFKLPERLKSLIQQFLDQENAYNSNSQIEEVFWAVGDYLEILRTWE